MRAALMTAGWLLAALAVIYTPLLNPRHVFSGMDFLNLLYPQTAAASAAYQTGHFPLWSWELWGGAPLLAAMQAAPLYPLAWVAMALPLPFAMSLFNFAHLLWASLGAAWCARVVLGVAAGPAAVAGLLFAGGGFFLGHIEQSNSLAAISYTPWILGALWQMHEPSRGRVVALAVVLAFALLTGHPQYPVLAVTFGLLFAGLHALMGRVPLRRTARMAAALLAGFLLAGCFAAAQILPTRELGQLSERIEPYSDPDAPALAPSHLAARVVPRYFNRLAATEGKPLGHSETGLYAGLLTPLLALAGSVSLLRRRRALAAALLSTAVLALLHAFGGEAGVASHFRTLIPFLAQSRGAARSLAVESLLWALLAAAGLQALLSHPRLGARPAMPRMVALLVLALVTADLALTHSPELRANFVDRRVIETDDFTLTSTEPPAPNYVYRFTLNDSNYYLDQSPAGVRERIRRIQPNLNLLNGAPLLDGYEEGLLPTLQWGNLLRAYNRNLRDAALDAPLLALLGSRDVLTEYGPPVPGPGFVRMAAAPHIAGDFTHWRSAYPSAFLADLTILARGLNLPAPPERLLDALTGPGVPPERLPASQTARSHALSGMTPDAWGAALVPGLSREPNALTGIVTLAPGHEYLLLMRPYPGHRVRLNGDSIPVTHEPAVGLRFTVPDTVPPTVFLRASVEPFSFRLGLFVSTVAWALLAALALRPYLPRPRPDRSPPIPALTAQAPAETPQAH